MSQEIDWDERCVVNNQLIVSGIKAWSHNIAATAVVDNGDGTVTITTETTHGFAVASQVYIDGTTNYDGTVTLTAVTTTTFTFTATYTAETPAGSGAETVGIRLAPVTDTTRDAFQLMEVRLTLSAASVTSESYTVTLNSEWGSVFDNVPRTRNMNGRRYDDWGPGIEMRFTDGDELIFTYNNTDGRTYGLEVKFKQLT